MIEKLPRGAMNSMVYFPARELVQRPGNYRELRFEAEDGVGLHGWWIPTTRSPANGHILLCHGNAGNISDRIPHADLLCAAGYDVLLFDYRGYGQSEGRPGEAGTYADARAARLHMFEHLGADSHVIYLGESLG